MKVVAANIAFKVKTFSRQREVLNKLEDVLYVDFKWVGDIDEWEVTEIIDEYPEEKVIQKVFDKYKKWILWCEIDITDLDDPNTMIRFECGKTEVIYR